MDQAGLVVISLAGLWIAYLVPHRLRYRQQLLESRAEDRFSAGLRVLRVAVPAVPTQVGSPEGFAAARERWVLHRTSGPARGGGGPMDRPHGTADRISADAARRSAAEHARRRAYLRRRAAAARRRALLSLLLLGCAGTGWVLVGALGTATAVALVPTVLLGGVLVLGRRAVVAGARADAEWEAGAPSRGLAGRAGRTTGRAVHPSEQSTEILPRVPRQRDRAVQAGPTADVPEPVVVGAGDEGSVGLGETQSVDRVADTAPGVSVTAWAPVPVPRPTYTFKPAAPRREPAPLVLEDATVEAPQGAARSSEGSDETPRSDRVAGGLDLDAILARRRAAGE